MARSLLAGPPALGWRHLGPRGARPCCRAGPQGPARGEDPDGRFMAEALREAEKAARLGEVPVGAVLVQAGAVIARAHNRVEGRRDPTAHAELLAIQQACASLRRWDAPAATLYVTVEPCPQCVGALLLARVGRLVFGARSPRAGAVGSWVNLLGPPQKAYPDVPQAGAEQAGEDKPHAGPRTPFPLSPPVQVREGVGAAESQRLMQEFFRRRRQQGREAGGGGPPSPDPA